MGRVVSTKAINSVSIALVVVVVTKGGDCVWNGTSLQMTPSALWQEQQSVETCVGTCLGTLIPLQGVYCSMDNHQGGRGLSGLLKGCCAERWFDTAEVTLLLSGLFPEDICKLQRGTTPRPCWALVFPRRMCWIDSLYVSLVRRKGFGDW